MRTITNLVRRWPHGRVGWHTVARLGLVCAVLVGASACASATGPVSAPIAALAGETATVTNAGPTPFVSASPAAIFTAGATPIPTGTARPPIATAEPVVGLKLALTLADQEMSAARSSGSLDEAQRHAQAVINTLVGAWGRWYDSSRTNDLSDRRGVFPGERVPGPANDTPGDWSPVGWGMRAFDLGDPSVQTAVQLVMGDVGRWRATPRARYDEIARASTATDPNHTAISRLDGRGLRAVAWARLILTQAVSLPEAQRWAALGSQETGAALSAVQSLPQSGAKRHRTTGSASIYESTVEYLP
jgi:hypothetical protein